MLVVVVLLLLFGFEWNETCKGRVLLVSGIVFSIETRRAGKRFRNGLWSVMNVRPLLILKYITKIGGSSELFLSLHASLSFCVFILGILWLLALFKIGCCNGFVDVFQLLPLLLSWLWRCLL